MLLQSPVQLLHGLYCCSPKLTFFFFFCKSPNYFARFFWCDRWLVSPVSTPRRLPRAGAGRYSHQLQLHLHRLPELRSYGVPAAFPHVAAGWVAPPPPSVVVSVMIVYRIVQLAASPSAAQAMPCRNMEIEDGDRGGVKHTPRSWRAASHACARYTALPRGRRRRRSVYASLLERQFR